MSDVEGLAEDERAMLHPCYSHLHEAVERIVAAHVQAARVEALEEAAQAWCWSAWSDVLLPKPPPSANTVIAYSNRVGDWLRARAAALRAHDAGGEGL